MFVDLDWPLNASSPLIYCQHQLSFLLTNVSSTCKSCRTVDLPFIKPNCLLLNRLLDIQEAQLMLTTGLTRLAVSRGQQTWYHSTCHI